MLAFHKLQASFESVRDSLAEELVKMTEQVNYNVIYVIWPHDSFLLITI